MIPSHFFNVSLISAILLLPRPLAWADDLTTEDGKTYKDYKVIAQDGNGITIMYTDTQKISFDELPVALQKKLGHDPEAAIGAMAAKKAQELAVDEAYAQKETELNAQEEPLDRGLAALKEKEMTRSSPSTKAMINGQIFVAAQGGESIRFDGVRVGLIPIDLINRWLPEKEKRVATELQMLQPRVEKARKEDDQALKERDAAVGTDKFGESLEKEEETRGTLDKVLSRRDYFSTGEYYADSLGGFFVEEAVTDLNGKFSISAPDNGDFVLVAWVESRTGNASKKYYWFVKVHPATATNTYILLDSENMASSGSADSIVKTQDVSADSP